MQDKVEYSKLYVVGFGLALGVLWAVILFVMAVFAGTVGSYGLGFVQAIGALYIGYHATLIGALIGAVWGFLDGFICGVVFAWLYNVFLRKCFSCKTKTAK